MVLGSDLALTPECQAWTTGDPSNKYCWFLYLHECRFFLFVCLFSSNSATKKSVPVGFIAEQSREKTHKVMKYESKLWAAGTEPQVCVLTAVAYLSLSGGETHTHAHTHFNSVTDRYKKRQRGRCCDLLPCCRPAAPFPSTCDPRLKHYQALHVYC